MSMNRRKFIQTTGITLVTAGMPKMSLAEDSNSEHCDVFVYGSTPGGIAAAIEAARRGCKVILACPKFNAGGMKASGLCASDAVREEIFGGIVQEYFANVLKEYEKTLGRNSPDWAKIKGGWRVEPGVAERIFDRMLEAESDQLKFLRGHHLVDAKVVGDKIKSVRIETPDEKMISIIAKTFIDGTYEGDLAAAAKVPYRVGRESREEFGESLAGIHYMDWKKGKQIITPDTGEASPAIQAYCARSILTNDPEKLVPLKKPDNYDQHLLDLLPLIDDFKTGRVRRCSLGSPLPNRKFELNGSIVRQTSVNCPGVSWAWPEAGRHHRARLEKFHVDHALSYMWFLQNDPHVPRDIQGLWKKAGLHRDEFTGNEHMPWQIYVRQGRRITGRAKVTQHNFIRNKKTGLTPRFEQAIAIGEHSFDVHPCHDRRFSIGRWMEGVLWYPKKADGPAQPGQVPYGAMLPNSMNNLLVPVALSSTHIAMSVLRMEPLWMTTGQIAGLAAWVAKEKRNDVASIDPTGLPKMLGILTVPPK